MPILRLPASFVRAIAFGAIIVAGVLASFGLYRIVLVRDQLRRTEELDRQIDDRHALIRETLRGYEDCLFALDLLFANSTEVTRREFEHAAAALIGRYPGVFALQWVPLVPGAERDHWEQSAAPETGAPLPIVDHDDHGRLVRAAVRPQYFPILFSAARATDWNAIGCDIGAGSLRAALNRARNSAAAVMSGRIILLSPSGNRDGVVMILPVFLPGDAPRTLRGFLMSVFRVDDLLVQSWNRAPESITDVMFIDESAKGREQRLLYYHAAQATPAAIMPTEDQFRAGPHRALPLAIGTRRWEILYRPTVSWAASPAARPAGLILLAGLVITALFAGFLSSVSRHTRHIEHEVAERTAELSESRRQLHSLVQALPGMAYRGRYEKELTVLYASEGTLALTGYAPEELISGRVQFREIISPDDLAHVRERTRAALDDHSAFEVEYRIHARDGREKWVLSRGRGIYADDGRLLFFEGLAIDITARKQAEAAKIAIERKLLESQKLESLGLLAGGIAHDFNNLLAGILGNANLARFVPGVGADVADHLRKIEAAAARAAELCQQMLAYSGRGRFVIEAVDLGRLVRDTLPLLKSSIPTHANLELMLAPEPTVVMADSTQIRQIVMNLILNAADALGAVGGDIVVSTGRRLVDGEFLAAARVGETLAPGEYVFFEVRDTGCGMSPDTLAKIFDPFFTTKFTGRGLGLAAVLGIVRGHGGGLRVQSEPGRGSTFTLLLPPTTERLHVPGETSATPWRRAGKILVIDDEAPVRDVAAELIRTFGFTVVTAVDGTDGIARFREDPSGFDLVFLDLTMPGLDGGETLVGLRAIAPAVRVLLVSGYSENERIAQLAAGGPLLFMQKPFTRGKLERKLREILL